MTELIKYPEEIEKKIMPYLAELIHNSVDLEKEKVKNNEILDK